MHDSVWGTLSLDPWESTLLELSVFQRLRGLRQTGFAYLTYPTAEHSRFQHTLGVMEAASRIFDSLQRRINDGGLSEKGLSERADNRVFKRRAHNVARWRMLLRLAALVHDIGHSVFSHSSERVYALIKPFPELMAGFQGGNAKRPGAAEVMVYLLVTSPEWRKLVDNLWNKATQSPKPPTADEWERIGRWVLGQETARDLKFLADIISGPFDADKLDYVFRDGYVSGIPVGYDLMRLIATICVDPQEDKEAKKDLWRLTLSMRGINALEQLVMGRLVLNSYLYHHHKCRAAECAFERTLAREYLAKKTVLGRKRVWDLFGLQDADTYEFSKGHSRNAKEIRNLYNRRLRVRVVEFRGEDVVQPTSQRASFGFTKLTEFASIASWDRYEALLAIEDRIARKAGLAIGTVIVDVPKSPDYADLENVLLPGRRGQAGELPANVLTYRGWISAYASHRSYVRVFAPRGQSTENKVWNAAKEVFFKDFGLTLPEMARVAHR